MPIPSSWGARWPTDGARPGPGRRTRAVAGGRVLFGSSRRSRWRWRCPRRGRSTTSSTRTGTRRWRRRRPRIRRCSRRWQRQLTHSADDAWRQHRLRRQHRPGRAARPPAYTAQCGVPRPVRAGQPDRAPLDVHRHRRAVRRVRALADRPVADAGGHLVPADAERLRHRGAARRWRCRSRRTSSESLRPGPAAPAVDVGAVGQRRRRRCWPGCSRC